MDIRAEHDEIENITTEEIERTKTESGIIDKDDIPTGYITEFEARKTKELTTKTEKQREDLRHLIGVEKRKGDASEETLITFEESIASDEVSVESLIHPCLREIDISDSQLKLVNPYTVYPIPNDPGLVPAFSLLYEHPPSYDDGGVYKFYDAIKRYDLRPIKILKDMFVTDEINVRYYGLVPGIMKALYEALGDNNFVQKLDLKDNKLSPNECRYLNKLLLENNTITDLSLSNCQIGANGMKQLYDALLQNTALKTLDFSGCNIRSEGFEYIASALSNNQNIESINLSNNYLNETCADDLRDLLLYSGTLAHLDLSWNFLNSVKTWKTLIKGLENNKTLRSLILSLNGLGQECMPYLYNLILYSQNIEKLDLSCNRFTEKEAERIAKALSENNALQELNLGNNPLKPKGALALVYAITQQTSSVFNLLNLENIWAHKEILQELETIKNLKPWITIKLGGILSNYKLIGPNVKKILMKRANYEAMKPKRKQQRRDFGIFVMTLEEKLIPRTTFAELVRVFKLKLSSSLVKEIIHRFRGPKNTVDQEQLKAFYIAEYPAIITKFAELQKNGKFKSFPKLQD